MCYSPKKDASRLLTAAEECIKAGNLSGAERLLTSARQIMSPAVYMLGPRYIQVQKELETAKRNES